MTHFTYIYIYNIYVDKAYNFFFFNLYNRYHNCEFRAKELANFIKCTLVKSLCKKNRDQHFSNELRQYKISCSLAYWKSTDDLFCIEVIRTFSVHIERRKWKKILPRIKFIYNVAKRIMNILSNFQEYKILRKFLERKLQVAGNESLQINEMEMDYHDE